MESILNKNNLIESRTNQNAYKEWDSKFRSFYEHNFDKVQRSIKKNKYFYELKDKDLISKIPPGKRILDIGCWAGDLLNKLKPSYGVGIDLCNKAISLAKEKHNNPNLNFIHGNIFDKEIRKQLSGESFDVILLVNTISQAYDVTALLKLIHEFSHVKTRIFIYNYSQLWEPLCQLANITKLRVPPPEENWLPPEELKQMFYLANLQEINSTLSVLFPFYIPIISSFINKFIAHLPLIEHLNMQVGFTLRPIGEKYKKELPLSPSCSVITTCKNEAGNIRGIVNRMPNFNSKHEIIFVEGNSTDNTEEEIKTVIKENPDKPIKFIKQTGKGKADALRLGGASASGDIVIVYDGDLTIAPEDLSSFYEILKENKAEFVNGTRFVYPMEKKAMRFLNLLGNKFFAMAFSFILGQPILDTLCANKALWKNDFDEIMATRELFGDIDPFGDFDLLFGAIKQNLKIIDYPVRYKDRIYGTTNISRFKDGFYLLKMTLNAFKKIKMI